MNPEKPRGHFLTFDLGSPTHCAEISAALKKNGVLTDYRGQKLRIGFGLYHTEENILKLISRCETRK
jgi:selenocysteine lyase/cysteine desulfurase